MEGRRRGRKESSLSLPPPRKEELELKDEVLKGLQGNGIVPRTKKGIGMGEEKEEPQTIAAETLGEQEIST